MEELIKSEKILLKLNYQSLAICREVSRTWNTTIDHHTWRLSKAIPIVLMNCKREILIGLEPQLYWSLSWKRYLAIFQKGQSKSTNIWKHGAILHFTQLLEMVTWQHIIWLWKFWRYKSNGEKFRRYKQFGCPSWGLLEACRYLFLWQLLFWNERKSVEQMFQDAVSFALARLLASA